MVVGSSSRESEGVSSHESESNLLYGLVVTEGIGDGLASCGGGSASEVLHWTDTLHGREEWDIIAVIDILGENCTSSGTCESLLELHLAWVCLVQDKVPWNLSQCNLLKL